MILLLLLLKWLMIMTSMNILQPCVWRWGLMLIVWTKMIVYNNEEKWNTIMTVKERDREEMDEERDEEDDERRQYYRLNKWIQYSIK